MAILLLGMILFCAVHLVPAARPDLRAAGVARLGLGGWKIAYTILSLLGLFLIVQGYGIARETPILLWFPPAWTVHLNNLLMVLGVAIYVAGPFKGTVARAIRHPQLTGVKTWAVAHLLVNGDLGSVILFGGFLAWAVVTVILINKRDGPRAKPVPGPRTRDLAHAGATLVVFGAVAWVHNWLGVWPFPG